MVKTTLRAFKRFPIVLEDKAVSARMCVKTHFDHNVGCPWQTARISGHGSQASSSSVPRLRERKEGSGVAISRPPTSRTMPLLPSAVGNKVSTLISSCMLSKDTENAAVSNGESSPPECE